MRTFPRDSRLDREFFLQQFGNGRGLYEAMERCGRRRPAPRGGESLAFKSCKRDEKVELVLWQFPQDAHDALGEYNLTALSWSELHEKGFRWSITGEILFPADASELEGLIRQHRKLCYRINLLRTL